MRPFCTRVLSFLEKMHNQKNPDDMVRRKTFCKVLEFCLFLSLCIILLIYVIIKKANNISLDSLQFENNPSDCTFEYAVVDTSIAKIVDNTLQAIFVGTTTLKVQVARNGQTATFEACLTIQKGTICFEKTFLLTNLKDGILTIDVASDFAKVQNYAQELSSEQVECVSQTIFVTAVQNFCVAMSVPSLGTATLTIQTKNIDISYSIAIE